MPDMNYTGKSGISYRTLGSGPAVILLHGFPGSGMLWRNIWDHLAVNKTVIVPDLPGSGNSPLNGTTGIRDMAEMIKGLLDEEGISDAVIAGHSMGGYIALSFASLYPDRVVGLSLVHSTPDADDEEKIKTRKKAISLIEKGGKQGFINQMVPNLFSETTKKEEPGLISRQIEDSSAMSAEGMINFYNAMIDRQDTNLLLDKAVFPVQWICGVDDNVIPCKKITGKTHKSEINFVSFYNNCGHMSMLEAPGRLSDDLVEFTSYCFARGGKKNG